MNVIIGRKPVLEAINSGEEIEQVTAGKAGGARDEGGACHQAYVIEARRRARR